MRIEKNVKHDICPILFLYARIAKIGLESDLMQLRDTECWSFRSTSRVITVGRPVIVDPGSGMWSHYTVSSYVSVAASSV